MENIKKFGHAKNVKGSSSNFGLKKDNGDICFDADFVANKFNNLVCNNAKKTS